MSKLFKYIIFLAFTLGCKDEYLPKIDSPATGYLVVEGFINTGSSPTNIKLSRTTKLYDSVKIIQEHNAVVNIEGENQEQFPLLENGNGQYTSATLNLNKNEKYHLKIKTQNGHEYVSDFEVYQQTPDIDSISWIRENNGVKIYVNSHNPQNNTKYYQWKFEETWEFHSTYRSSLKYFFNPVSGNPVGVAYRSPAHQIDSTLYKCWKTVNSSNIFLGTSEKLGLDLIYLPLAFIENGSVKLSVLYSINVRQYALSHLAYLFFEKLKKNTEQLGSIFDAQPSELQGNIHCTTNPSEIVIGFVNISEEKTSRIFISNNQLPDWNYSMPCAFTTIDNNTDSIIKYGIGLHPTIPFSLGPFGSIKQFNATPEQNCMDCTLRGTNIKPQFWP